MDIPLDNNIWQGEDRLTLTIPAGVFPYGHMYIYPRLSLWMEDGDVLGRTILQHCLISVDRNRPLKVMSTRPPESDFPALYYDPNVVMNEYERYIGTTIITISRLDADGNILSTNTYETGETGVWFNHPYTYADETEQNPFNLKIANVLYAGDGGYDIWSGRAFPPTRDADYSVLMQFWSYSVDADGAIRGFLTEEAVHDFLNILYLPTEEFPPGMEAVGSLQMRKGTLIEIFLADVSARIKLKGMTVDKVFSFEIVTDAYVR